MVGISLMEDHWWYKTWVQSGLNCGRVCKANWDKLNILLIIFKIFLISIYCLTKSGSRVFWLFLVTALFALAPSSYSYSSYQYQSMSAFPFPQQMEMGTMKMIQGNRNNNYRLSQTNNLILSTRYVPLRAFWHFWCNGLIAPNKLSTVGWKLQSRSEMAAADVMFDVFEMIPLSFIIKINWESNWKRKSPKGESWQILLKSSIFWNMKILQMTLWPDSAN